MNDALKSSAACFVSKWFGVKKPSPEMASDYALICKDIPKLDEGLFLDVIKLVRSNMEKWALQNSQVYLRSKSFYCKEDLEDKSFWYVPSLMKDSLETHTSGSSTGFHFMYRRMKSTFEILEWDNHYDMVLDEFGVRGEPEIMYFFPNHFKKNDGEAVYSAPGPQPYLNSHGRSRLAKVHYANFDLYKSDSELFFRKLFEHLSRKPVDVLFSSGPQINSMCYHLRKFGFKERLGKLLSQTNERLLDEDASFLFLENSYFDFVCDHMRCWDGGASFFTCRSGNYHLMDNLSWCEEIDGRLVSTDYFNFASPFVRYWNGDICRIGKDFQRCECGRLYREFEFLENRPFSLNGVCLGDLRKKMLLSGIQGIKQVKCYVDRIDVVSSRKLADQEILHLSGLEPKLTFNFLSEHE